MSQIDERLVGHVSETGQSRYSVAVDIAGHAFIADEPVDFGGGDLGPGPFPLLAASLATCTAITVRWYAQKNLWPLEHVKVDVSHEKQGMDDVFGLTVHLTGDGLSPEQRATLMTVAAKCPVHRTLTSGRIRISVDGA